MIQIKDDKKSYYAVDNWLDDYDYSSKALTAESMHNIKVPDDFPKTEFERLNWNQWNYETMSMMNMFVRFHNPVLESAFLVTMSDYIEKIVNPFEE